MAETKTQKNIYQSLYDDSPSDAPSEPPPLTLPTPQILTKVDKDDKIVENKVIPMVSPMLSPLVNSNINKNLKSSLDTIVDNNDTVENKKVIPMVSPMLSPLVDSNINKNLKSSLDTNEIQLIDYCTNGSFEKLHTLLLSTNININCIEPKNGATPIIILLSKNLQSFNNGLNSIIKLMISMGADISRLTENGTSCLHIVCYKSNDENQEQFNIEIIKSLIENLDNSKLLKLLNTIDKLNNTPMAIAAKKGNWEIVKFIFRKKLEIYNEGIDLESIFNYSDIFNLLYYGTFAFQEEFLCQDVLDKLPPNYNDLIIQALNSNNNALGYSILILAAQKNLLLLQYEILNKFSKKTRKENINNSDNSSSIDLEIKCRYKKYSSLFWAAFMNNYTNVLLLAKFGANLETRDSSLLTPLDFSVSQNNYRMTLLLLQLGAGIHHSTFDLGIVNRSYSCIDLCNHFLTVRRIRKFSGFCVLPSTEQELKDSDIKDQDNYLYYDNGSSCFSSKILLECRPQEPNYNASCYSEEEEEKKIFSSSFSKDMGTLANTENDEGSILRNSILALDQKRIYSFYQTWDHEKWKRAQQNLDSKGRSALMYALRCGRYMFIEVMTLFDPQLSPFSDSTNRNLLSFASAGDFIPSLELLLGKYSQWNPPWDKNNTDFGLGLSHESSSISKVSPIDFASPKIRRWFYVNFPRIGLEARLHRYDEQVLPRIAGNIGLNSLMVACSCSDLDAAVILSEGVTSNHLSCEAENGLNSFNISCQLGLSEITRLLCERISIHDARILLNAPNRYGLTPSMVAVHSTLSNNSTDHKACLCKVFEENDVHMIPPKFHLLNAPIYESDYTHAQAIRISFKPFFLSLFSPSIGFGAISQRFKYPMLGKLSQLLWLVFFALTFLVSFSKSIFGGSIAEEIVFPSWIAILVIFLIPWLFITGTRIRQWHEVEDFFEHQIITLSKQKWKNIFLIISHVWVLLSLFSLSIHTLSSGSNITSKFFISPFFDVFSKIFLINLDLSSFPLTFILVVVYLVFVGSEIAMVASLSWPESFWWQSFSAFSLLPDFLHSKKRNNSITEFSQLDSVSTVENFFSSREPSSVFSRRVAIRRALFHQLFVSSDLYFVIIELGGFTFLPAVMYNFLKVVFLPDNSSFIIILSLILLLFYFPIVILFSPWLRSEAFRLSHSVLVDIRFSVRSIQIYKLFCSIMVIFACIVGLYSSLLTHTWLLILAVSYSLYSFFYTRCSVPWFGDLIFCFILAIAWFNFCILFGSISSLDRIYLPLGFIPFGFFCILILFVLRFWKRSSFNVSFLKSFGPLRLVDTVEKFFDDSFFLQSEISQDFFWKKVVVILAPKGIAGIQQFYALKSSNIIPGELAYRENIEIENLSRHEIQFYDDETVRTVGVQLDLVENIVSSLIFITSKRVIRFGHAENLANTNFLHPPSGSRIIGLHGSFDRYTGLMRSIGLTVCYNNSKLVSELVSVEPLDLNEQMLENVRKGDLDAVKTCLTQDTPHAYIDHIGRSEEENGASWNWTALTASSFLAHSNIVGFLIDRGADVNLLSGDKCSALFLASWNNHFDIVQQLLSSPKVKVNFKCFNGWTALFAAALFGNVSTIELLLDSGADVLITDLSGRCASDIGERSQRSNLAVKNLLLGQEIFLRVVNGDEINSIDRCLKRGANINSIKRGPNKKHWTPLTWVISQGNNILTDYLLSKGANIHQKTGHSFSPLYIAAQNGYVSIVEKLLNSGVTVSETSGTRNWNPLFIAAAKGYLNICRVLINANIDPLHRDIQGHTALYFAASEDIVQYLRPLTLSKGEMLSQDLIEAIANDEKDVIIKLLDLRVNVNFISQEGEYRDYSPLALACSRSDEEITALLFQYDCDPNLLSGDGFTPLYRAVQSGCYNCVQILLENKAQVDLVSDPMKKRTPLMIASANGYIDIVKLLLRFGANLSVQDVDGKTALDFAQGAELLEFVRPLLLQHKDICREELLDAVVTSNIQVVEQKISQDASSVNYVSKQGQNRNWNPLTLALSRGNDEIVDSLLSTLKGIDVNLMSADHYSPLYRAAEKGNLQAVEKLLKKGARINDICGLNNWTPLHVSCANGFEDVIRLLVQNTSDICIRDKYNRLPIDLIENRQLKERLYSILQPKESLPEPSFVE